MHNHDEWGFEQLDWHKKARIENLIREIKRKTGGDEWHRIPTYMPGSTDDDEPEPGVEIAWGKRSRNWHKSWTISLIFNQEGYVIKTNVMDYNSPNWRNPMNNMMGGFVPFDNPNKKDNLDSLVKFMMQTYNKIPDRG